jgi:hypothetical protein
LNEERAVELRAFGVVEPLPAEMVRHALLDPVLGCCHTAMVHGDGRNLHDTLRISLSHHLLGKRERVLPGAIAAPTPRAAGIAADVVAAWHGHTERMTQAVYGRVTDDRLTAAADVFSSAVGQI